jgi:hypothetical protein
MALNMTWSLFRNYDSGPAFVAGFILGSLACLICRFAIGFTHHLRKHGIQDDKALNMDAAEKGGLEIGGRISLDEDLFSLEKRAFFNQVCQCAAPAVASPFCVSEKHRSYLRAQVSVNADGIAVVALCMPS